MKIKNKKIIISIFVFVIISLLSITVIIANNTRKENFEIDTEKILYEIKYMDSKILYMTYLLNNIENKINFYIEWSKLEDETIFLYNYWNSVILDLNYLEIDKKHLRGFSEKLDNLSISIKNKDKHSTFKYLLEMYNKLLIYSEVLKYEKYTFILKSKYNLLCAYVTADTGNWTIVHEYILEASDLFLNIVNSMETSKYSQHNINQIYIRIKELENIINIKDLNLFYFKYKNVIDKLESLTFE